MPQLLTLSRASRLVGVTRSIIQKKIKNGDLPTFEGQVALTDLLRAYPDIQLADTAMLEQVERIKKEATPGQRLEESALPSALVLTARLAALSKELVETKSQLSRYSDLFETITQRLNNIDKNDDIESHLQALSSWLTSAAQNLPKQADDPTARLLAKDTVLRIMAAQVKVIPSGHEFFIDGNDSILEASLRAGLALNHGCASGNCGLCKARIVTGEAQQIRHHDYILSQAEKNMGYKLMCSYTAVTDITVEAAEANDVKDMPLQQVDTKVKNFEFVNDDLLVLHLQTPRTQTLRFLAGQSATLTLNNTLLGEYFIASCPCDGRNLKFHLYQAPYDQLLQTRLSTLKNGQTISVEGPTGDFILEKDSTRPIIFIAYAHGFAPISSLIEHALALDMAASFHLYWIASSNNGHYQNNQCRAWADALDNFQYTRLMADEEAQLESALSTVTADYPDLSQFDVYLSGAKTFTTVAEASLRQHNLPETQLHLGQYV